MYLFAVTLASLAFLVAARDPALDKAWEEWKLTHSKVYRERSEELRRGIWEQNLRKIQLHNQQAAAGHHTYVMAMNHLGDLTHEEFNEQMNGFVRDPDNSHADAVSVLKSSPSVELPTCVDWRQKGIVTAVKDQGSCGSCWAFSAIGALESMTAKNTGKLLTLSEQNLVDCSWSQGNQGCNGGWPHAAFKYIARNSGVNTESVYPYEARDGQCRFQSWDRAATCRSYGAVAANDEQALAQAVATVGPISVAIDASNFQFYSGGVYYDPNCSTRLNHAVLAVGYCKDSSGMEYWIVKNSWGASWGENGYIRMAKGYNLCGIAEVCTYPI